MTRTWSLVLSCTTFAITEACAFSNVPGGSVAKPTVGACASAAVENATAPIANRFLNFMNPPPRVLRVYRYSSHHENRGNGGRRNRLLSRRPAREGGRRRTAHLPRRAARGRAREGTAGNIAFRRIHPHHDCGDLEPGRGGSGRRARPVGQALRPCGELAADAAA